MEFSRAFRQLMGSVASTRVLLGILLVHAILLALDLWTFRRIRSQRTQSVLGAIGLYVGFMFSLLLTSRVLIRNPFFTMNAAAHALFFHVPLLSTLLAIGLRAPAPEHQRVVRHWRIAFALIALSVLLVGYEAFVREPSHLTIQRVQVRSNKLNRTLRIAVFSDVQFDEFGDYEREAFRTMMREHPDVILLPGDYIHPWSIPQNERLRREANAFLRALPLAAPLGVYAVEGNAEGPGWEQLFDGLDVHTFNSVRTETRPEFSLTAMGLLDSFNRRLRVEPAPGFHIAMGHGPDFSLGNIQADLLIAGHTHGGQVQLPWIGPIVTLSGVPRSWASGVTQLSGGRTLIVSRGVGMERSAAPRLRFLCYPEIVMVEAVPAHP